MTATQHRATPPDIEIEMRRMDFGSAGPLPRHWASGSKFITHWFNAMSAIFPDGEKFFINALRQFESQIKDEPLRQQLRGFLAQEGHHGFQHRLLNAKIGATGVDLSEEERWIKRFLRQLWDQTTPAQRLAITCALEHYTALLGDQLLKHPEDLAGLHPHMLALWRWHAVEETEHKSVAYDVYQRVVGSYYVRVYAQFRTSLVFIPLLHAVQFRLMRRDDSPTRVWDVVKGFWYLWGKPGGLRRSLPGYLSYYRPGFHPWQLDNRDLITRWKQSEEARYRTA